ncbi:MAG TPA: TolC family protein [Verrucomicrobiae bacterium]|nr:TolC family protein [Verrucomicrobiae bacterium]
MRGPFKFNWRCSGAGWLLAAVLLCPATNTQAGAPLPPTNFAQTLAPGANPPPWAPNGPLTVDQALQRALSCDSRIASLRAAVEVAREQRLAATDFKDPEFQAESRSVEHTESASSDDLDDSRLSLGVPVPNPWLMVPRVDARTADYRAAQADLNAAIWQVQCDVRRLFAQLNYLTNNLGFSADRVRLSGEVLKAVQARVEHGAATATDLMTASRQYLQYQSDFDQTCHSYQLARQQLAALLDVAPESFDLATNPVTPPSLLASRLTFPQVETVAVNLRWDLAAVGWRAQAAESSYHEILNKRLPWVEQVKGGYDDDSARDSDKYWVGLVVNVPIFSWTKNHAADAALANAKLAAVAETNELKLIRQELHDALDDLDRARQQADRNESAMNPLITTMRQTLATLKATPNVMPGQVAAAELELVEAVGFELDTQWQYQLALLNFERALGGPLPPASITDAGGLRHPMHQNIGDAVTRFRPSTFCSSLSPSDLPVASAPAFCALRKPGHAKS